MQGFEERATGLERDIRDSQKRAKELEAKVGAPFEHEKRYHQLAGRSPKLRKNLISPKTKLPARSKMVPATRPRKRFHSNRLKRKQMDKTDGLRFGYEYAFNDTR